MRRFLFRWLRWLCLLFVAGTVVAASDSTAKKITGHSTKTGPRTSANAQFEALPLIRSRQNQLLVKAYINGKAAWLGVDSGAPVSAINTRRREYFKLTAITSDSNLPMRVQVNEGLSSVAIAKSFRLGNLNLVDQPIVTLDLESVSTRIARARATKDGLRLDGIIGADVLFPLQAVLDCQSQLLILNMNPSAPGRPPGVDYRGFNAVPIQVSDGLNLYVNGAVNGTPAKLMVDTGAFATLLHRPFVRQLHIPTQQTHIVSAAVNLREKGVHVARIRKLSVGSVELAGNLVGVTDLSGLIQEGLLEGRPPVAGLLGAEILNRNHGIIDFGTKTLYLKRESNLANGSGR